MDTLKDPLARIVRRASRWLAAGTLCLGAGACASLEPREEPGGDVERLAERLVQTARERSDLRQIRVWVAEIREERARTTTTRASMHETPDDLIGLRLEHELVIALATRLNVVESELVEAEAVRTALDEGAAARGATHVLVGEYVRQRDALQITLRLVDADSRLIVAAARGAVKLSEVGLTGYDRWAENGKERGTLAVPGSVPRTTVSQTSPAPEPAAAAAGSVPTASVDAPQSAPNAVSKPAGRLLPPTAAQQPPQPPPKPAVAASSSSRSWPIEDFETWRQRRLAEQPGLASETVATLDDAARASTEPAVRARRNELSDQEIKDAEPFPWRRDPWLAQLLGIPQPPPSGKQ